MTLSQPTAYQFTVQMPCLHIFSSFNLVVVHLHLNLMLQLAKLAAEIF